MEEPLQHREDTTLEIGNEKPSSTIIHRKKNKIRNLIFAVLAGMATFSIIGKPWPEVKPVPREKLVSKSPKRESWSTDPSGKHCRRIHDCNGEIIFEEESKGAQTIALRMFHNGTPFGLYPEELEKDPSLTPEKYIDFLAEALNSHERLHAFFTYFWQFAHDSPNPQNPLQKGSADDYGDYVQTPEETLMRVENHKMLYDCDDIAVLSYAVISRQPGRRPHIITTGDHVFTAWIEERHGLYDAFSIDGTLMRNGKSYWPENDDGIGTYKTYTESLIAMLAQQENTHVLSHLNQPPYNICTFRPFIVNHRLIAPRLVPALTFDPKSPFPWSYEEIILTLIAAHEIGHRLKKLRDRMRKGSVAVSSEQIAP